MKMFALIFSIIFFCSSYAQDKIFVGPISYFQTKIISVNDSEIVYHDLYDKGFSVKTIKRSKVRKIVYSRYEFYVPRLYKGSTADLTNDKIELNSGELLSVRVINMNDSIVEYIGRSNKRPVVNTIKRSYVKNIYHENRKIIRYEKDTSKYIAFGIIPYQLFSRSSGGYITYKFKKPFSIDYRYTYTFATEHVYSSVRHSKFFYHGDNHTLAFTNHLKKKRRTWGLLLGYKHWWYSGKFIPLEEYPSQSSYSRPWGSSSANIKGINFGLEHSRDLSVKKFNGSFFMNFSVTPFTGLHSGYYPSSFSNGPIINYSEGKYSVVFVYTGIGFKFGGKIKLNKGPKNHI